MNPKDIFNKYNIDDDYGYSDGSSVWVTTRPSKNITIEDVLYKFTPEQLIEAIGVDEVQNILRNKKLNILKKKLNK
jgi:hypothetical protein